jgi:hypothetical protein
VRWPYLNVPTAPIDERDIAAVAVRTLCEDTHSGAEYVLTGPQSLSQFEQIATIGAVLGRSLRIEEISPEDWVHELPGFLPSFVAKYLLDACGAAVGQPAFLTSTVAELTGSPARTWETPRHESASSNVSSASLPDQYLEVTNYFAPWAVCESLFATHPSALPSQYLRPESAWQRSAATKHASRPALSRTGTPDRCDERY